MLINIEANLEKRLFASPKITIEQGGINTGQRKAHHGIADVAVRINLQSAGLKTTGCKDQSLCFNGARVSRG